MSDILSKIQEIVASQLGVDKNAVQPEKSFTKDLGADSLDVVELVMSLEEEFEIEIDDQLASSIDTVQNAMDYINAQIDN